MLSSKKFLIVLMIFPVAAIGQTVKVKKETARVKGENLSGWEVELEGTAEAVRNAFSKFVKTLGKVKQSDDDFQVSEPSVNGLKYTYPISGVVKEKGKTTAAWIGIHPSKWPPEDAEKVNKELEKMMKDFGVKFYRDQIQVEIDESARAQAAVEKQQQRLVNENKSLGTKLEDNKREKIQLDKSLENNKLENETLLKKIDKNKHDQDSVALAGEQIKKMLESQKEKQRKVN